MTKPRASSFEVICFSLLILFSTASSQGITCPFGYLYHFGDGVTDVGNSIYVVPNAPNPAGQLPYGSTFPGYPTGRWSDGLVDFDYTAEDFGLPNIVPYLAMNSTNPSNYQGVIFSVARSPVLDRKFFKSRGITIPEYTVSLSGQMAWFKKHIRSMCKTQEEFADWLANSLVLLGDIEGNDVGYPLTQGKSIREVRSYVPRIIKAQIDVTRELLNLGAKRVIIPGNGPLGCFPYILTALRTNDSSGYDELGCLKRVNNLIIYKNDYLLEAIEDLQIEFPEATIMFGPMYDGVRSIITNASVIGPDGNSALKSCCGIGGQYNYDSERFCGSEGVPVCSNPNEYIFWDGLHFTQQTHWDMEDMLVRPALVSLRCTSILGAAKRNNNLMENIHKQIVDRMSSY